MPIIIVAFLAGITWLDYISSVPTEQIVTTVHGKVAGFRLGGVSRFRGEQWALIAVTLPDGSQGHASAAIAAAATCHVGDPISVDRYTNRRGYSFLRAGAHPCG
uniref:hypothetical protein n=1 Tax=Sphingomonas bacterium TaxID=1895847 RepID=UPI002632A73E|nr:hypothetical protein [Sphingomonas bacterium]